MDQPFLMKLQSFKSGAIDTPNHHANITYGVKEFPTPELLVATIMLIIV